MFNSNAKAISSSSVNINACSGGIYKTYIESWFERFNLSSKRAEQLFNNHKGDTRREVTYQEEWQSFTKSTRIEYVGDKTVVLQMVICGDMEVMVELIDQKDLLKYFENPDEEK
jgi:hypothetical protein